MTPEDASRRERLADQLKSWADDLYRTVVELGGSAMATASFGTRAAWLREAASILRAASPAAPGPDAELTEIIETLPLTEANYEAVGTCLHSWGLIGIPLADYRAQPEPRAEEGERITPSRHQPKPSGIPGGTITSEGERIDPEDAQESRVTPTGVASPADDNAYHRNYTEAAMAERPVRHPEKCERHPLHSVGPNGCPVCVAERDGGVEELAAAECDELANLIGSIKGYEDVLHQAIAKALRRAAALLRSRTQPVGEPKWYEVTDSVLPDDPFTMRASNSALKELRGFTRYEIRPLYASPQPASVDVEAQPNAIRHRRGPSARWMYEDWTPSIVSSVLEILPETGEIQPLYRALGTQKGGE